LEQHHTEWHPDPEEIDPLNPEIGSMNPHAIIWGQDINLEPRYYYWYNVSKTRDLLHVLSQQNTEKEESFNQMVKLIKEGADPNGVDFRTRYSVLGLAAARDLVGHVFTLTRTYDAYPNGSGWTKKPYTGHLEGRHTYSDIYHRVDNSTVVHAPLFLAAKYGNKKTLHMLLGGGADINEQNRVPGHLHTGYNALMIAMENDHYAEFLVLLSENGQHLDDVRTIDGYTILHLACKWGINFIIRDLLVRSDGKLMIDALDNSGNTPLALAAAEGHEGTVVLLLDNFAHPLVSGQNGETPLLWAVAKGHGKIIRRLLNHSNANAMIVAKDCTMRTPLHEAASQGYAEIVAHILNNLRFRGENPSESGSSRKSGVFEDILIHPIYLDAQDHSGATPLIIAAYKGYELVVKELLDAGADPDIVTIDGSNALLDAAGMGHTNIVRRLIEKGANIDNELRHQKTAMLEACKGGHMEVVSVLIENGANVNKINFNNVTPLHVAAANGNLAMMQLLVENGADVHFVPDDGWSLGHVAAHSGNMQLIEWLENKNVSLDGLDTYTEAPLKIACRYGHFAVAQELLNSDVKCGGGGGQWYGPCTLPECVDIHKSVLREEMDQQSQNEMLDPDINDGQNFNYFTYDATRPLTNLKA